MVIWVILLTNGGGIEEAIKEISLRLLYSAWKVIVWWNFREPKEKPNGLECNVVVSSCTSEITRLLDITVSGTICALAEDFKPGLPSSGDLFFRWCFGRGRAVWLIKRLNFLISTLSGGLKRFRSSRYLFLAVQSSVITNLRAFVLGYVEMGRSKRRDDQTYVNGTSIPPSLLYFLGSGELSLFVLVTVEHLNLWF